MPNGKGEPECWTYKQFVRHQDGKNWCAKHGFEIPVNPGALLICRDWEHYDPKRPRTYVTAKALEPGWLYCYTLYSDTVPARFASFEKLRAKGAV